MTVCGPPPLLHLLALLHQLQQLRPAGGELALRAHGEVCGGDVVAGGDAVGEGVLTLTAVQACGYVTIYNLDMYNIEA